MRKKKRSGARFAFSLFLILGAAAPLARADKKKPASPSYGLVAGTVFQASGYALPNASVSLLPDPQSDSAGLKVKKMETTSDARGEFVFRVPPAPMQYVLTVSAKGFLPQQKSVRIEGEQRIDVTFQLEPESKH
jgi:hypothetical protein